MTFTTKLLAGVAGIAAFAAAAPATAQYYGSPYRYQANPYANQGYGYQYGNGYAYGNQYNRYGYANQGYAMNTNAAAQQCSAAVQQRLNNRVSLGEIIGAALGVNSAQGRVLSITQVNPNRNMVRIRGLASTGRSAGYGAYGVGAYGALGYSGYAPDLNFRCDVDYRGYVRDVSITRR